MSHTAPPQFFGARGLSARHRKCGQQEFSSFTSTALSFFPHGGFTMEQDLGSQVGFRLVSAHAPDPQSKTRPRNNGRYVIAPPLLACSEEKHLARYRKPQRLAADLREMGSAASRGTGRMTHGHSNRYCGFPPAFLLEPGLELFVRVGNPL